MRAISTCLCLCFAQLASAGDIRIDILPPDLTPADVCNRPNPTDEPVEEGGQNTLTSLEKADLLRRDINGLRRNAAVESFDYIMRLITLLSETDPEYAGISAAFDRVELYQATGRFDELNERKIVDGLTLRVEELTNSQKVRLAIYYRDGIGVEVDTELSNDLIVLAAYAGNANALFELVRLITNGEQPSEWELNAKETATLAYGGLLGKLDGGYCARAERLAREYEDSAILVPNPDLALAWRKHAADFGGRNAAWDVVEHYLNAPAEQQDDQALMHYLKIAVSNKEDSQNLSLLDLQNNDLKSAAEIRSFLGYNSPRRETQGRVSAVKYLELENRPKSDDGSEISDLLIYLREISKIEGAPGSVHFRLANEIAVSAGIWGHLDEYLAALEQAVALDDPDAKIALANHLVSFEPTKEVQSRAENLLLDAVSLQGHVPAMLALSDLYRCRSPEAPMVQEADFWEKTFQAADLMPMSISSGDLARLDPLIQPEAYAEIQTFAVRNAASSMAHFLQLLQSKPVHDEEVLEHWARKVGANDQSLETYTKHEFALARTAFEGDAAVELTRRAFLAIGPAMALDAAVILIDAVARDEKTSKEVDDLLRIGAKRGEGASIRLLARLSGDPEATFKRYEDAIEKSGDFLAQTFALEFVEEAKQLTYFQRAKSLMRCTVKDALELAEAAEKIGQKESVTHWIRVSNAIPSFNPLSNLGLSQRQVSIYAEGSAPQQAQGSEDIDAGVSFASLREKFWQATDQGSAAYNPEVAANTLLAIVDHKNPRAAAWAALNYYDLDRTTQLRAAEIINIDGLAEKLASDGNGEIALAYANSLRRSANSNLDLAKSTEWLRLSAEAGHGPGMYAYGVALGHGIGVQKDLHQAIGWLVRADRLLVPNAKEQITIFSIMDRRE